MKVVAFAFSFFAMIKTFVYIDGFNLYYGALKGKQGYRWLDPQSWLSKLLTRNDIVKIKYFTARATGKYDLGQPVRQATYWRALKTLPNVEIIEGKFLFRKKSIYINSDTRLITSVPEEKRSDVNLSVHLVNDAHLKRFDTAVVVSNDSDLSDAIRIVTQELKLKVGLISPCPTFHKDIAKYASFKMQAREGAIIDSQFPAAIFDVHGKLTKPLGW